MFFSYGFLEGHWARQEYQLRIHVPDSGFYVVSLFFEKGLNNLANVRVKIVKMSMHFSYFISNNFMAKQKLRASPGKQKTLEYMSVLFALKKC